MKLSFALLLVLSPVCSYSQTQSGPFEQGSYAFFYDGISYSVRLSAEEVSNTPSWNPARKDPPLSVRQAAKIARAELQRFVKNSASEWDISSLALTQLDLEKWVYTVNFQCYNSKCQDSRAYGGSFRIAVKMDGSTIQPEIKPDERAKEILTEIPNNFMHGIPHSQESCFFLW